MDEREYIVTLYNFEDLDSFYEDMETPGGNLYIPDRAVEVVNRRPVSRNTHYRLTEEEAASIKNDPRVMNVELTLKERGLEFRPLWTQTSSFWNKSNLLNAAHRNWGLLRCIEGVQLANWGFNGTTSQSATVKTTSSGKHVDVVIVDGHINPAHPEFAVNSDGTGGSRVNQFNWFSLTSQVVNGGTNGTYVYPPYVDPSYPDIDNDGISDRTDDNDHGCHVAGTAAGNTFGWARDANIYNISPYGTNPNGFFDNFLDYVKVWHQQKAVNPITGRKNPTISNHSYGITRPVPINQITSIKFRGSIYTGPFDSNQLLNFGIYNDGTTAYFVEYSVAYETDMIELIEAGVIVVGSAGNTSSKIDNFTYNNSADYNNYLDRSSTRYYYNRGSISASPNVICVGAISSLVNDSKSTYSNCGPRVDIYAPGDYIISSVNSSVGVTVGDSRNSSYRITKKSGTSMASPQVTGALACLLEQQPRLTQLQVLSYLQSKAKLGQITATTGGPTDYTDLQGSANRYLYYAKERGEIGQTIPRNTQGLRTSNGLVYPRTRIYRYGS